MTKMVKSSLYGGASYSTATIEEVQRICTYLTDCASSLRAQATSWLNSVMRIVTLSNSTTSWCAKTAGSVGGLGVSGSGLGPNQQMHCSLDYSALRASCEHAGAQLNNAAQRCQTLCDMLSRAYSIYADAEIRSRQVTNEAVQLATRLAPMTVAKLTFAQALGGWVYGIVTEGNFGAAHALNAISWQQEGLMRGVGSLVAPSSDALGGASVAQGASVVGSLGAGVMNLVQGNQVSVQRVEPAAATVTAAHGTADAIANLRALSGANANAGDYATIAISQYVDADGQRSWLVTIPGTDGHGDSPLGWEQNVELMSSQSVQRRNADSARMVVEAMRQAGVEAEDNVAVIGHSQGGIVAATLASDYADEFRFEHIVTAGSPIANHPIGENTWVTSVEMEDELVAALDGDVNPRNEQWLTIRAQVVNVPSDDSADVSSMTCVDDAHQGKYELTHDLAYHQAAYENAAQLGSPALQAHDEHFQSAIRGDYAGTTYWQGRMSHAWQDGSTPNGDATP